MTKKNLFFGVLLYMILPNYCYLYTQNTLPDIENAHFIEECVKGHNKFRSSVDPPASNMKRMAIEIKTLSHCLGNKGTPNSAHFLISAYQGHLLKSWDHDLAKTAVAWAKMCQFQHNPDLKSSGKAHPNFTVVGENIWTGSLSLFNVTSALTSWYNEVKYYNYATKYCLDICGHYTQMVWATTYKVGCAVHFCPRVHGFHAPNAAHFICNYGPGGNYPTWPYKSGVVCSECHGEPCIDRLCGKEWVESYCDQYCIIILVLRSSLFLIVVLTVFFLMQCYPNMSV